MMEAHKPPGPSESPFYDADFVASHRPTPRKYQPRKKPMPITTRSTERWICDRCGAVADFPDDQGRNALAAGWLRLDLTRSLKEGPPYLFGRNEQILCPTDVAALARWFQGEWQ